MDLMDDVDGGERMHRFSILAILAILAIVAIPAGAQGVRYDVPPILGQNGLPLHNVGITLCTGTASVPGNTCSPPAQSFTDITLGTQCASGLPVTLAGSSICQATSDAFGNAGFWLSPGTYVYCLNGQGITGKCFNLTVPVGATAGGGLVGKSYQSIGLNLTAYGADPTGAADSTTSINNAIADSVTTGLPIYCDGTFKITSTLNNIDPGLTQIIAAKNCTILAGAVMTNMATIGGTAPPPYSKGIMQGILWDGNGNAAHALQLGCSGVSCSTQFVNGMLFEGVRVKSTTGDCIQTGNNVWAVGFANGSAMNCGGNGVTLNGGNNALEGMHFNNFIFGNNTGAGLSITNPGTGGQSVFCSSCEFDQDTVAGLQVGTSSVNGDVFNCSGCHFEFNSLNTTTRFIINFGDITCSGCFFTGAVGNSTFLIDNEGNFIFMGGFVGNGGTGTFFNSAQSGTTMTFQVRNYAPETAVNIATDTSGNLIHLNTLTLQSSSATAINVPNGGFHAGGFIKSDSGLQPSGGSTPQITGDGTNVVMPQTKFSGSMLLNSGNPVILQTAPTIAGAGCGGSGASISSSNGTAAFLLNTGTAPTAGGCTVTMPTATNGWTCFVTDTTTLSTSVFVQKQTGGSTTSVVLQNFNDVAVATAPTANDNYRVGCSAF